MGALQSPWLARWHAFMIPLFAIFAAALPSILRYLQFQCCKCSVLRWWILYLTHKIVTMRLRQDVHDDIDGILTHSCVFPCYFYSAVISRIEYYSSIHRYTKFNTLSSCVAATNAQMPLKVKRKHKYECTIT